MCSFCVDIFFSLGWDLHRNTQGIIGKGVVNTNEYPEEQGHNNGVSKNGGS